MNLVDKITQLTVEFSKLNDEYRAKFIELLNEGVKEIFSTYSKLSNFSFEAWTMGFNDGEPCYYAVYADDNYITMNGLVLDDIDGYHWNEKERNLSEEDTWMLSAHEDISRLAYSIPSVMLQQTFEEGRITFFRDKEPEVEYVSHD